MARAPLVPGLTLGEDVVGDAKGRISVIRAFTGWSLGSFPRVVPTFCVFAPVTAGLGDAVFRLRPFLGNQALIQNARGKFEESLALLQQVETLSRRIDDGEGLAFALLHQAS